MLPKVIIVVLILAGVFLAGWFNGLQRTWRFLDDVRQEEAWEERLA